MLARLIYWDQSFGAEGRILLPYSQARVWEATLGKPESLLEWIHKESLYLPPASVEVVGDKWTVHGADGQSYIFEEKDKQEGLYLLLELRIAESTLLMPLRRLAHYWYLAPAENMSCHFCWQIYGEVAPLSENGKPTEAGLWSNLRRAEVSRLLRIMSEQMIDESLPLIKNLMEGGNSDDFLASLFGDEAAESTERDSASVESATY